MRCLLVAAAAAVVSARAHAGNPLEKPAFTATPKELLDAAKAAKPSDRGGRKLREELQLDVDDKGLLTSRYHVIVAVDTEDEADEWKVVWRTWQPWDQEHPKVRARTITASGQVHDLDPSTLADDPGRPGVLPYVRGSVPVDAGSILEEEIVVADKTPVLGGHAYSYSVASYVPVLHSHFAVSAPVAAKLKVVTHALVKGTSLKHTTSGGRETWTYDASDIAGGNWESDVPRDTYTSPAIMITTAKAWSDVARAGGKAIESQLTGPLPPELHAGDSLANAQAVTAWLHAHVKYNGSDLLTTQLALNRDETLRSGSGTAAEVGLLLASLLRAANMPAEVVLVDRGPEHGVDRDVPWLGAFDHVLVRATVGGKETWIDPEDADLPVGQLRADDQGRPALALGAAALIDTPRAPATANVMRTFVTYTAADMGSATLTVHESSTGFIDADQRHWMRDTGDAEIRKKWTKYVAEHYLGHLDNISHTAIDDLSHSADLDVEISEARRAMTHWDRVEVHLFPADASDNLPWPLRDDKAKPRVGDLAIAEPQICDVETRIVVPAGFAMPTPVAEKPRQLGVVSFVERQRVEGRTLIVTYHLELAKLRLTAAEVNATRTALIALGDENEKLTFEHEAWALADRGKLAEAVQKMTAEVAANPGSGMAHARLAQVLLFAGAGDAARREGRKATELAPKRADAFIAYAYVLSHDVIGNRWTHGHDHAGTRKALETAHALSPKSSSIATELATALERGARGRMFGDGADLAAAAIAWRAAYDIDASAENARGLARSLLWSGDAAGAEQIESKQPASVERDTWILATRAVKGETAAALRDVPSSDRTQVLTGAIGMTTLARQYDAARSLVPELGTTTIPGFSADLMAKLKRFDPKTSSAADPMTVAGELMLDELDPGAAGAIYWDAKTADDVRDALRKITLPAAMSLVSGPFVLDVLHASAASAVEGDANAWRVEMKVMGVRDIVYIAADHGVPKIIGTPAAIAGVGRHLARLAGKHDDVVTRVLDWIVQDRSSHQLPLIWGSAYPKDAAHINLAIALLADDPARKIAAGTACGMTTTDGQLVCDLTAVAGYRALGKWAELEPFTEQWVSRATSTSVVEAISERADALCELGRLDEAEKLVDDALAQHPDEAGLLANRLIIAAYRHQTDEIIKRADALAQAHNTPGTLNNVAWTKYLQGIDLTNAREQAQRAMTMAPKAAYANTAAALDVEVHDLKAAVADLRKEQTLERRDQPSEADWLVLGRIYEACGLREDAIAAYRHLKAPKVQDPLPSSYSLAQARLKILGVTKK